jgi:membrane protein YqaA with SNARE-associated domain
MLIPMTIFQKKRGVVFALTTIIASVFGAMFGYALGRFLWDIISPYFFNYIPGFSRYFDTVGQFYKQNAFAYLMIAGFTPIPYKVFTVVAGVYHELISLSMVVTTAIISRGIRYSLFVFLLSYFSQKRAILIVKKYFGPITIVITLLAIAAVCVFKMGWH